MTLPEYSHPPVVEVVCGAQFEPVPLLAAYLGRLLDRLPEGFRPTRELASLMPIVEHLGEQPHSMILEGSLSPRVWFESAGGEQLVQIQSDRLLFNWRKQTPTHDYPRYPAVWDAFERHLGTFEAFVEQEVGSHVSHRQFELTYINHIEVDGIPLERLAQILPDFSWRTSQRFLPTVERMDSRLSFLLPNRRGRLHVRAQNGLRNVDQKPVLILELTARGFAESREDWFALAHEWIVRGFADLTGEDLQRVTWERREA